MTNQKSLSSSDVDIPEQWREKFIIKRINKDDIEVTLEERNGILQALTNGARFIQIRKYTLMVNAMESIEPKWGDENIPPRPELEEKYDDVYDKANDKYIRHLVATNKKEIELYDKIFGIKKALPAYASAKEDY